MTHIGEVRPGEDGKWNWRLIFKGLQPGDVFTINRMDAEPERIRPTLYQMARYHGVRVSTSVKDDASCLVVRVADKRAPSARPVWIEYSTLRAELKRLYRFDSDGGEFWGAIEGKEPGFRCGFDAERIAEPKFDNVVWGASYNAKWLVEFESQGFWIERLSDWATQQNWEAHRITDLDDLMS